MDVVVKCRHTEVSERFRRHVIEKLSKVERLDGRVSRVDVEVSHENNPRLAAVRERVELTCRSRGPAIRAEAAADDKYAALDLAMAKLEARLRKSSDRRRVHHGTRTPMSVYSALPDVPVTSTVGATANGSVPDAAPADSAASSYQGGPIAVDGEGPLVVREKVHAAAPMTLEQALFEMELVGHDFYLFLDSSADAAPSVVYRRRGYDYGVIRIERTD